MSNTKITAEDIEANISSTHFFTAQQAIEGNPNKVGFSKDADGFHPVFKDIEHQSLSLLTFCVLVLKNGFTVTGESACVNPDNFDAELGKKIAKTNAVNKVWPLMGYALKEKLSSVD